MAGPHGLLGRRLLGLFLVALALRLLPPLVAGPEAFHSRGYSQHVEAATNLLEGRGLHRTLPYGHGDRHAIRTPLYPLLVASCLALSRDLTPALLALAGALFGAATCALGALQAGRWFGPVAAWLAAIVLAAWPRSVLHDAALQETSTYTFLFAATLVVADRLRAALVPAAPASPAGPARPPGRALARAPARALALAAVAGGLGALAVLTRANLLPAVLLVLGWAGLTAGDLPTGGPWWRRAGGRLWCRAGTWWWRRAGAVALAVAVLAAGLAPWLARNQRVVGAPVLVSDTGRSLWLGNNPQLFSVYPRQSIDRAEELAWAAVPAADRAAARALAGDELASDDWFRARALAFIRAEPRAALAGAARKAWATFSPWHDPEGSPLKQAVHLISYGPVAVLALLALVRFRRRWLDILPVPAAAALLAAQSAVFFGHSAYRAWLDPWMVVLAAGLLADLLGRLLKP